MRVSELYIYPIKSLGGILLNEAIVEERGLKHDRRFMLTNKNGDFFTQREFPVMAKIAVSLTENYLQVSADSFENLQISFEQTGESQKVRVWDSICEATICHKNINQWFSDVIKTDCQLVFMNDNSRRNISPKFNLNDDIVSFADGYPCLLIGENSLMELNSHLDKKLLMNRFRPNIVVSNSEPFAEDHWQKIRIGDTLFRSTKPCARCVMTTIDQAKGVTDGTEPLKTLATYRQAKHLFPDTYADLNLNANSVLFGQNLVAENFGSAIKLGNEVEVIA